MGMFDYITVEEDNELGLPSNVDYQSKCLNCALDNYIIKKDGSVILSKVLSEYYQWWLTSHNTPSKIPAKITGVNGNITIYGDDKNGKWHEYELTLEDGKVSKIEEYGTDEIEINIDNIIWDYDV